MRSLYWKIGLSYSAMFLVSMLALAVMFAAVNRGTIGGSFFQRFLKVQLREAVATFETQGPEALRRQLKTLDETFLGRHRLLDAQSRDVLTGEVVSVLSSSPMRSYRSGKYELVVQGGPRPDPIEMLPYMGTLILLQLVVGMLFALHLARPLKQLRSTVERFGLGDLTARSGSRRKDEIGQLARAFDEMAGRVENLLLAEQRLTQDVAHELRTPLTRLSLAIELQKNQSDREAAAATLKREVQKISSLLDQLLHMVRAEGDPAERDLESVDTAVLLREVVEAANLEASSRQVSLEFTTNVASVQILGDRELLERALENIVRNAIRYAPDGSTVRASVDCREGWVVFAVEDQGPGVPEEALESIFKPFYRVESHRSRESGGVGLGLSIAMRAILLHRGKLWAENTHPGLRVSAAIPVRGD